MSILLQQGGTLRSRPGTGGSRHSHQGNRLLITGACQSQRGLGAKKALSIGNNIDAGMVPRCPRSASPTSDDRHPRLGVTSPQPTGKRIIGHQDFVGAASRSKPASRRRPWSWTPPLPCQPRSITLVDDGNRIHSTYSYVMLWTRSSNTYYYYPLTYS